MYIKCDHIPVTNVLPFTVDFSNLGGVPKINNPSGIYIIWNPLEVKLMLVADRIMIYIQNLVIPHILNGFYVT